MNQLLISTLLVLAVFCCCKTIGAQDSDGDLQRDIKQLQSKIRELESDHGELDRNQRKLLDESGGIGVVLILFGTVCALWAQNTGRSSWLWFFLGFIFSIITVLVMLSKNADDLHQKQLADRRNETFS